MGKAARAIVIEGNNVLVMYRNKYGSQYYTLLGGRLGADENPEEALACEVEEETGLKVNKARLVYFEDHPEPYNQQFIYLCEVDSHGDIALLDSSEEAKMNRFDANIHKPYWASKQAFANLPFRTPQLQIAIVKAFKHGFPKEAEKI